MDIGTIIGLVVAMMAIVLGIVLGGGSVGALLDTTSVLVVLTGTLGATIIAFPLATLTKIHTIILKSIFGSAPDPAATIKDIVRFAEIARREGILSLENHIHDMNDPFIINGIRMAIDGTDPELIKEILDTELEALMERHERGKGVLDAVAKYAPAYGMIGTLLGLIFMLQNMDDPAAIGPGMAVALITTLYGALVANIAAGPIGDKLAAKSAEEVLIKSMVVAGVMSIQSGDNPRVVESKLLTYLPPNKRAAFEAESGKAA